MKQENTFAAEHPDGKIVHIKTLDDCISYLGNDGLANLNSAITGLHKVEDYLPFYAEYINQETITVNQDHVYSKMPKIFKCNELRFDGGSITSYVQLSVVAGTTTLVNPSPSKNYQVMVCGTTGASGTNGKSGTTGTPGPAGSDSTGSNAGNGSDGGPGGTGNPGGTGSNGGITPVANLSLGTIVLGGSDLLTVITQGGSGGNGGNGGTGGTGGSGGNGGNAHTTGCGGYNGGTGGAGGKGGQGGAGGNGGNGSIANNAMTIIVNTTADRNNLSANALSGNGGQPGYGGNGGTGGVCGSGGSGSICGGNNGAAGKQDGPGAQGNIGNTGNPGGIPQMPIRITNPS